MACVEPKLIFAGNMAPIIMIPSSPTSLITMHNVRKFLEDAQYVHAAGTSSGMRTFLLTKLGMSRQKTRNGGWLPKGTTSWTMFCQSTERKTSSSQADQKEAWRSLLNISFSTVLKP